MQKPKDRAKKAKSDAVVWFAYPKRSSKKYKSGINRDNGWQILGGCDLAARERNCECMGFASGVWNTSSRCYNRTVSIASIAQQRTRLDSVEKIGSGLRDAFSNQTRHFDIRFYRSENRC
jgi:hypothetical protein